uniref:Anthocyanidin 3-O-glucosyltransferase n=1 Tax=Aegilops tauschii TaxID=37682 RepID=R7WC55_AEGTA
MAAVPHVVVITFPFASHAVKLFRLARALAAAAPAATFSFLSTAGSIAQLQEKNQDALEANLRFVEVPDGLLPPSSGGDGPAPPQNHIAPLGLFLAAAEAGGVKEGSYVRSGYWIPLEISRFTTISAYFHAPR